MNWHSIFLADVPLLETILRGSLMYLALFTLLRVVLKRQTGSLGISDLLLITLLADASQNALAGEYRSLSNGLVLVATILFWSFALDWLAFKFPWFSRLVEPRPLPLIQGGRVLHRNLRREFITQDELLSHLRQHGLDDVKQVKEAYLESDGQFSVVPLKTDLSSSARSRARRP